MVTRVAPQEYFGTVTASPPEPVQQPVMYVTPPQPTQALLEPVNVLDDQAFKYIMVIGLVIVSIAAVKYILKD